MNKMNTLQQMEELLQKFYDGASTVDEEHILQEFLNSADCPEDWEVHRSVFDALETPAEVPVPDGLAERIAASLQPRRPSVLRRLLPIGAAAAAVLAIALIFSSLHEQRQPALYADTCDTPEEAAAEIDRTFAMLSQAMSQGLEMK